MTLFPKAPVPEHTASGPTAQVFHEIRQSLRVSGVNLNFRIWAAVDGFLPVLWAAVRPTVESERFEHAADRLRAAAVRAADRLPRVDAARDARLGESQRVQIREALRLYHYINPKLLLLTTIVRRAVAGEHDRLDPAPHPRIARGVPPGMAAMEMVQEQPDDPLLRRVFGEIRRTYDVAHVNSDYRTLALWPEYLNEAWSRMKPMLSMPVYEDGTAALTTQAADAAARLPLAEPLTRSRLAELGVDADGAQESSERIARLLPPLVLNIAWLAFDWDDESALEGSPFPAGTRQEFRTLSGTR